MKNPDAKDAVVKERKNLETIPAWDLDQVESKKEVILEAQRDTKKVHFAALMDTCHLKKCEVRTQIAEVQRQSSAPGDTVKDDSGAYAVFTERGSSMSQMTAAEILDVVARLPGCDGQAADAVSAYTPDCSKFPKPNVQMFGYVFHDTNGQNHVKIWRSRGTSWTKLVRSSVSRIAVGKTIRRSFIRTWMGRRFRIGNVRSFIGNKGYFCQYMWTTSKLQERSRMWLPCWRNWWKNVGLGEPTSFFDPENLGCTQRECKPNKTIIEQ